ncbi:MAG: SRPBCC family protein [Candidatus Lokiarchaeota archaeon]|nr:SRPBCC family protein [Candidatus Lokiarchaeota archaeon]
MPLIELKIELASPVEKIYEILNDYLTLPRWNIVVTECTQLEPKKYFLKTNVGDVTNIEIENIPLEKMTSLQEGSPMQKIGYIFEEKGDSTIVTLWAEFELEDQRNIMEMAGDLFLKSLKVYVNYLNDGGNPKEYKKSFSKIKKA